jgi:hypothetical protein
MKKLALITSILTCVLLAACSKQDGSIKSESITQSEKTVSNAFSGRVINGLGNQPSILKLFQWDRSIVAQVSDHFFEIDPEKRASYPIAFDGTGCLISLTTAFGRPFALGTDGNHQVIYFRTTAGEWKKEFVPPDDASNEDRYSVVVGNEDTLVVLGQYSCIVVEENTFTNLAYTAEFHPSNVDSYALWDGNLYHGYDHGEFGGGLHKLDLASGHWSEVTGNLPQMDYSTHPIKLVKVDKSTVDHVSSLCIAPDGNLKIVGGLSHMMGKYGRIAELTKQGLKNETYISNFLESNEGWNHEVTDFLEMRYNSDKEPVLLTSGLGLLVQRSGQWERITPIWPDRFYTTSFLIINDEKYLFGTTSEGVVLVDLSNDTESIIRIPISFFWNRKYK